MNINAILKRFGYSLAGLLLAWAMTACTAPAQTPVEMTVSAILTSARPTLTAPAHTPPPATSHPTRHVAPEMLTETALARITPLPSLTPTLAPAQINDLASPDGQWAARWSWQDLHATADSPTEYRIIVKVFKRDGAAEWIIEDQTGQGLGYGTTRFVRWSPDSRYIYFDSIWFADGSCEVNASNLRRLDVRDGSLTAIGRTEGWGHSFSPSGLQLAYFVYADELLTVILDLETDTEQEVKAGLGWAKSVSAHPDDLVWSSNEQTLAFATSAFSTCDMQAPSSVIVINRSTLTAKLLYSAEHTVFVTQWPDAGTLALRAWWQEGSEWWMDVETGKIIPSRVGEWASPGGQWRAEFWTAFNPDQGDRYQQFKVFRADGTAEWVLIDEWRDDGLGSTTPAVFHWSPEGRYLYYRNSGAGDGCGTPFSDLQRVDLTDGSVVQLLPTTLEPMVLAPDKQWVAYGALTLLDLTTGQERRIELSVLPDSTTNWEPIGMVWSPDEKALALTLTNDSCWPPFETRLIVRVDVDTLAETLLLRDSEHFFFAAQWPETNRILLKDRDGNSWWLDAETGTPSLSATATLMP